MMCARTSRILARRLPRRCKGTHRRKLPPEKPDGSVRLTENPGDVNFPVIGVSTLVGSGGQSICLAAPLPGR